MTEFSVSYNTENDCQGAELRSERRWNYAFWRQDESPVISTWEPTEETHQIFNWYKEQGITNIGDEPEDAFCPVGYEELLGLVANVARRLQEGKRLLIETDLSLSQISTILGFSSASYFSQSFRKAEGISPVEYRKANVSKQPAP